MAIRTLLLDAGGTIVAPNFARIADEFAREGVHVAPADLERAEVLVRFELDRPEVIGVSRDQDRWVRYLDRMARLAGVERVPPEVFGRLEAYQDAHNLWESIPAGVPAALDALKSRFRLGVVSNANGTVRVLLARIGLAGWFETVVDSHEEGIEKPDPRLFAVALARMGVIAAETAYVGDIYHVDVTGSRAAGLTPVLLDPQGLHADKPCTRVAALAEIARLW